MRKWLKFALAALLLAALALLGITLFRVVSGVVMNADLGGGEADPMFAETPPPVTRPPEMDVEAPQPSHRTLDDYRPEQLSPVDKTAEELAREAQAGG